MSGGPPDEEQLRAAYEAELSRVSALDVMLQATVSLLNVAALRMRPPQGGQQPADLEQVRDAIDGSSALLGVLEHRVPQDVRPLRDALSQLQMAYAREMQAAAGAASPAGSSAPAGTGEQAASSGGAAGPGEGGGGPAGEAETAGGEGEGERRPGPAESSGRLWVPGT